MKHEFCVEQFEVSSCTHYLLDNLTPIIYTLNELREAYLKCQDADEKREIWYAIIAILPSAWLQRRIVTLNYAVLQNMLLHRHNHKLEEWRVFCKYILDNIAYPEFLKIGVLEHYGE